ncbi:MAG: ribosomal protein S18-alanine N-acetyltransferase [Actinobacteria bacterium]|nr:ribosomal protein S18-alanine N-acetyltransferase [Actinomycetota bacterium]
MRRRHLAAVMPIESVSYPRPWSHNIFQAEIEMMRRGQRKYLVAREAGRVVGYGGLMFVVDDAHVTNIAVAASHRRAGVATRLLCELAWVAIDRGCQTLTLEVRAGNTAAQALYQQFGFVPAGVRAKYYENVEDAIVMWCNDLALPEYRDRLRLLSPEAAPSAARSRIAR